MDRLTRWTVRALLGAFALLLATVAVRAVGVVDFVDGTKIPAMLRGSHYFEPAAKTASFTVDADDNFYQINSSGGAITATLNAPTTYPTGKCWAAILKTAGNAVTFSAAPYSINGAVSTNAMDAAGDSYIICNNGAGFDFLARYIH